MDIAARVAVACLVVELVAPAFAASIPAVERKDVTAGLGPVICDSKELPSGLPLALWEKGIADAQLEGRLLLDRHGLAVSEHVAARKARTLAAVRRYQGYAYGLCPDGRAWAIGVPAAAPLQRRGDELLLPQASLRASCESWRVDFAANAGGEPRRLAMSGERVSLRGLRDGVVSLVCQPHEPSWRGPVEWYLSPVGNVPAPTPPEAAALEVGASAAESLIAWINRLRAVEKRPALTPRVELSREADVLAIDSGIAHNRKLLRKAAEALSADKLRLIGEDRVKARSVAEMAWLLWHSPRHRALLLDRQATEIGVVVRKSRDGDLAVIVVGDRAASVVGRNDRGAAHGLKRR